MEKKSLTSWNDTEIKKSLINFVAEITNKDSSDFIPEEDRIATFDNDGTLWTEQPLQVELFYALYRAEKLAEANPELKNDTVYNAFLNKDIKTLITFPKQKIIELLFKTHDGKTPEEFKSFVKEWFESAVHPLFKFSFYNTAFKPQLELLRYLKDNGFKIFIVSGGGVDFMRTVAEKIYGIPGERITGSSGMTKIEYDGTIPVVVRLPQLRSFDDRDEKVNNIHLHIGRRPVLAFGNSDGDLAMLRYTLARKGLRMALLLHHDDGVREVAYDKDFKISPLNEALNVAAAEGIKVVSMKNDWKEV
ncbi:MAG TPA: HAD family hydrolase, partial [Ignavibacteria bacterium]|nr:HAD family hydrolase [Ignavibacteria bacterium]